MKVTAEINARMANMRFAKIYPLYIAKVEKKGKTKDQLHQIIAWLTGSTDADLQELINEEANFEIFFKRAKIHPNAHLINAHLIKGVVCGYRIEEIDYEPARQIRYLEKLIDELVKGRKMEKILISA